VANHQLPTKLAFLFEPHRYKVAKGGRGSAKSWGFARALLLLGLKKKLFIVCAREIQKSIKDSVHRLLSNQIELMGLKGSYDVKRETIIGDNGTEFVFAGLRHNVDNIKSLEGADIVWVEEAHNVSRQSWAKLIPTVRKDGSEIWISFNPELDGDATYQDFAVNPPASACVVTMNWRDNPWFPAVLKAEMEELKAKDEDAYLHVYEGQTRQALEGAIFKEELRQARLDERIGYFPYRDDKPVDVHFDLGWSDCTSFACVQWRGNEARFVFAHQDRLKKIQHYVGILKDRGYIFNRIYMPHDAKNENVISDLNALDTVRKLLPGVSVVLVPRAATKRSGIQEAKTLFAQCTFDQKGCQDFLAELGRYRYEHDVDTGKWGNDPYHDEASHYGDVMRSFGRMTRGVKTFSKQYVAVTTWDVLGTR
jgi:phage terminase large subunit